MIDYMHIYFYLHYVYLYIESIVYYFNPIRILFVAFSICLSTH